MNIHYLSLCLRVMLVFLWTPTVAMGAALVVMVDNHASIPLSLVIIAAMLSSLAGATALLIRIDKELRESPKNSLPRPWLFSSAHMLGSWLAGVLAFLISQQQKFDVWFSLGFVIVASFLGAKFIEMVAERYLERAMPAPKEGTP